ncbi:MAG: hypothetical protein LBB46_06000, partial [Coriobacteriaceae bacterium]|nr:hypothetical protein [Coriobacteriaceae bacterium]
MSVHNAARCRKDKPLEDQSRNRVENQSRNKKGHAPAALVRLALAAALVLSWPGLLPGGLPGAQAEEPPGAATTIIEFERDNPVFSWSAEAGTPREHLPLPATVRALCPLPASQGEGFAQTLPVPDDDGDYDYYWYGYVAPRGAEALHAAGQPAVYTIYDADGRDAYRLHGTYDGANEGFYACDEQGNLTAAVVEVPVTWRGTYDAAKAENYDFIAKIEGFAFEGDAPTARIALISQESLQAAEAASNSGCCGEGLAEGSCPGTEGCTHGAALALHDTDAAPAGGADDAVYETDGPDGVDAVPAGDVVYEDGGLGDADGTYGADGPEAGMAASLEDAVAACSCGQEAFGHAQGCPLWVDLYPGCTCPDGPAGHTDAGCPYFVPPADCACGIDATNLPCQHDAGCPLWGPADCGCEGAAHDPGNRDCMLYSPVASL